MKSEDVAFARLAAIGPSPAEKARNDEVQRSISDCMKDVVADQLKGRAYDPWRNSSGGPKAHPAGAAPAKVPGEPSEPWRPMHPVQDWLRLGSTVADANLKSAEAALAKLEEEPKAEEKSD
jgi:hypothetical protein